MDTFAGALGDGRHRGAVLGIVDVGRGLIGADEPGGVAAIEDRGDVVAQAREGADQQAQLAAEQAVEVRGVGVGDVHGLEHGVRPDDCTDIVREQRPVPCIVDDDDIVAGGRFEQRGEARTATHL